LPFPQLLVLEQRNVLDPNFGSSEMVSVCRG
jgi:hypothetical protein